MTQKKRGRQSTEDRAVSRPVIAFQKRLPPPPARLTAEQQEIWRDVMGTHSGDLITPDCFPILEEYCRAVMASRRIGAELDRFEPQWAQREEGLKRWNTLQQMSDRAARLVASLATKLRLTVQARTHPTTAGRAAENSTAGRLPPWEFTGRGPDGYG